MQQLNGTRFGTLEFAESDLVRLELGLIGFPELQSFLLLEHKENSPFRWLQSVDEPGLAFLLTDPNLYVEDYSPEITQRDAGLIGLTPDTPAAIYTTATVPGGDHQSLTLNLAGPIVFNMETRIGLQLVIDDPKMPVKFRPFEAAKAA